MKSYSRDTEPLTLVRNKTDIFEYKAEREGVHEPHPTIITLRRYKAVQLDEEYRLRVRDPEAGEFF